MQRIPKYTAGMFKKKMPRFGASSIRMPRMPKPPKPKKFDEGGEVDPNEVIISPEQGRKEYAKEFAERERKLKQRDEESKNLVKRYLSERKKADAAEAAKKAEKDSLKKKFDEYMEDRKRQEAEADWNFMQQRKQGVRTARKGGVMKSSCCRGDGIAKKGKTRGKFV
jgi:hypothetical protein